MNTPEYYEPRAPRPHIDASRIRRRPRSRRRPLPAGLPLTNQREFSPPRPLRNAQVQTMISNLTVDPAESRIAKGRMTIRMRDGNVVLGPGEIFVVPRDVEHCPVAEEEAHVLLIEPTGTPNTGDPATAAARTVI